MPSSSTTSAAITSPAVTTTAAAGGTDAMAAATTAAADLPDSLLDVVMGEYRKHESSRCSRALILGTLATTTTTGIRHSNNNSGGVGNDTMVADDSAINSEVVAFHRRFVEDAAGDGGGDEGGDVSGVLLVLNKTVVVHLIEASSTDILVALLRRYAEPSCVCTNVRVASLTEDVIREYPVWGVRCMDVPAQEEVIIKDSVENMFQILKHLLDLGREVAVNPAKASDYIATARNQLLPRVPSVEVVQQLTRCTDVFSVHDFLDTFDQPLDIPLESELVWPVEPLLKV